jgi:hypothetical protein
MGPHKHDPNSDRVAAWLAQNSARFEGEGVDEAGLAGAVGLDPAALTKAVDHLEGHEVIVRWPKALTSPQQFTLKAGRAWPEVRDGIGAKAGQTG